MAAGDPSQAIPAQIMHILVLCVVLHKFVCVCVCVCVCMRVCACMRGWVGGVQF